MAKEPKPYTRILGKFLHKLRYRDLSKNDIAVTKTLLLDYIGYAVCSVEEKPARILRDLAAKMGGAPEATIIGTSQRVGAVWASLVNGSMGHMTELDDTHRGTQSHMGDSVLPAALAVGEMVGAKGKDVLTAIVAGYDCGLRAGYSVMPSHYFKGWHPTGTLNTFGAAMAAGKILGLDEDRLVHCIGLAGTQAAGNVAHILNRGMSKDLNPGKAAFNGVLAAILARDGFTGAIDIFESQKGFMALYGDRSRPEKLIANLGQPFLVGEVAHKKYPGCYHLHTSRVAAMDIAKTHDLKAADIKKVVARFQAIGAFYIDDPVPWTGNKGLYGPRFSMQFQIALALCEGEAGMWASYDEDYVLKKMKDRRVRQVMKRIKLVPDKGFDKIWPTKQPAVVTITTTNGKTYTKRVEVPVGEPENPMSDAEIERKFTILTGSRFSPRRIARIKAAVDGLEKLSDISELTKLLRQERALKRVA